MASDLHFYCDEMLTGLGRWLRIAGYDTLIAKPGSDDRTIIEEVKNKGRVFLSCDSELVERINRNSESVFFPASQVDKCVKKLNEIYHLDWLTNAFSRCSVCNNLLKELPESARILSIPDNVVPPIYYCDQCEKYYWDGSHVNRMRLRLNDFQHL